MKVKIYNGRWQEMEIDGYMGKFRKKPHVVHAVRMGFAFRVSTDGGPITGLPGDWLIQGVKGELYPCKPDVFEQTYEKVEEGEDVREDY